MKEELDLADEGHSSAAVAPKKAFHHGIPIADLVLRLCAAIAALGSAIAMATTSQTIITFSLVQFKAQFNDLPSLMFFVIANATVCGYLVLSLALSVFHIIKTTFAVTRVILIALDAVMLALLTAGASAAVSIVYLAHKGNANANWVGICQQYDSFCERISGSLIGSYLAVIALIALIILASIALARL